MLLPRLKVRDFHSHTKGDAKNFESKVLYASHQKCWEWLASKLKGYGQLWVHQPHRRVVAHRFSWILYVGEIPNGLLVLHKCDNRGCVNPAHLWLGTAEDNNIDCQAKGRGNNLDKGRQGIKHPKAKLTEEDVKEIRKLRGKATQQAIADEFGITQRAVSEIQLRIRWSHI